jgi:hypothetical protein
MGHPIYTTLFQSLAFWAFSGLIIKVTNYYLVAIVSTSVNNYLWLTTNKVFKYLLNKMVCCSKNNGKQICKAFCYGLTLIALTSLTLTILILLVNNGDNLGLQQLRQYRSSRNNSNKYILKDFFWYLVIVNYEFFFSSVGWWYYSSHW